MNKENESQESEATKQEAEASAVERLISCPFCGKKEGVLQANGGEWKVECYNCFSRGPFHRKSKEIAIKSWNKRAR